MGEAHISKLTPSTRITAGLLMLIVGFACIVSILLLGGLLGYSVILPLLAGPVLTLAGAFQIFRGLRERASS